MSSPEPLVTPRFAMLWAYSFVTFFSAFQLLPVIPLRILELGGSKAEAGWFLAVYTLASAFAAPLMGAVADRVGRKRLLITASVLFIFFSLAYGVISYLPLLWIIGAIHGSIWSGILASSSAIMSEFIPESRRTEGMAYWGLASIAATAIAPAVGLGVYHFGWRALCIELAVLSLVMALWASRLPHKEETRDQPHASLAEAWDWKVIRTTLSLSVVSFGYGGVTSYAAILCMERHIEPRSLYFIVYATTIVLVRLTTSSLGDRLGPKPILYPAFAAIPIAYIGLAMAQQRWQLVLSALIFGIGFGGMYPAFASFILGATDRARRARTFGSIVWAFDIGIGTGSISIGIIAHHSNLGVAFAFAAALSCLAIPIFAITSKGVQA